MSKSLFDRLPGLTCAGVRFAEQTAYTLTFRDGTVRPMTPVEEDWFFNAPDHNWEMLDDYDRAWCDAEYCHGICGGFYPELSHDGYCPQCEEEYHEYLNEMYREAYGYH